MRNKNYRHSGETRQKISIATKKFWESSGGLLKKQRLSKRTSERLKNKTYEQIYGNKAKGIKDKIGSAQKGIPKTKEHNRKNSESHKGKKRSPFSEEWKKHMSEALKGENGSNWQGGKSFELYGFDWTDDLRESIRKRDGFICQECGICQDELGSGQVKKLDIHHIDYNKKNLNPDNLISLCRNCHAKTNHERKYWIQYFKK